MTIEISRDTYRMLTQLAAVGPAPMTADELAEKILAAFVSEVMQSGGMKVRDQLREMGYL